MIIWTSSCIIGFPSLQFGSLGLSRHTVCSVDCHQLFYPFLVNPKRDLNKEGARQRGTTGVAWWKKTRDFRGGNSKRKEFKIELPKGATGVKGKDKCCGVLTLTPIHLPCIRVSLQSSLLDAVVGLNHVAGASQCNPTCISTSQSPDHSRLER